MSKGAKTGLLAAAVIVAAIAFVALRPSGGSDSAGTTTQATTQPSTTAATTPDTPPPRVETIKVSGGEPAGGVSKLSFREGERIRFRVTDDSDAVVHLHGYDIEKDVGPGSPATFNVPATITGRFEVELHGAQETQIAEVTVEP